MCTDQKLADQFEQMILQIEQHTEMLLNKLKCIQLFFFEVEVVTGRPIMKSLSLKAMAKGYAIGLSHLAPSDKIRKLFQNLPLAPARFQTYPIIRIVPRVMVGCFVPWRIKIVYPEDNSLKIERFKQLSLLTCPSSLELDQHLDWFESEDASDSQMHQLFSIQALWNEENMINFNANALAEPVFRNAVNKWQNSTDHSDKISTEETLRYLEFAPSANQTVWEAWQVIVRITRAKNVGIAGVF